MRIRNQDRSASSDVAYQGFFVVVIVIQNMRLPVNGYGDALFFSRQANGLIVGFKMASCTRRAASAAVKACGSNQGELER